MHKNHSEKIKGGLVNFSGISKSIAKRGGFFSRLLMPRRRKCKKNSKKNTNNVNNNTVEDLEIKAEDSINNNTITTTTNKMKEMDSPTRINIYSANNSPNRESYSKIKKDINNNEIIENLDSSNLENEEHTPIIVKSEDNYKFKQISHSSNKEHIQNEISQLTLKNLNKLDLRENYLEKSNTNTDQKDVETNEKDKIISTQKDDWTIV